MTIATAPPLPELPSSKYFKPFEWKHREETYLHAGGWVASGAGFIFHSPSANNQRPFIKHGRGILVTCEIFASLEEAKVVFKSKRLELYRKEQINHLLKLWGWRSRACL